MGLAWKRAEVSLGIKNRIVGGVPANPKLIEPWIASGMPDASAEERKALAEKTLAELPAATEEAAKDMWTTFKRDRLGLYVEGRCVKAMFREAANVMRELLIKGERADRKGNGEGKEVKSRYTNLKAKLAERLFVERDELHLTRDGKIIELPDGNEERAIHVMTALGPRTALKRYDYVNAPALLKFNLRWLPDGVVDLELIGTLLEYASWGGMGADRSQGNGLFDVIDLHNID